MKPKRVRLPTAQQWPKPDGVPRFSPMRCRPLLGTLSAGQAAEREENIRKRRPVGRPQKCMENIQSFLKGRLVSCSSGADADHVSTGQFDLIAVCVGAALEFPLVCFFLRFFLACLFFIHNGRFSAINDLGVGQRPFVVSLLLVLPDPALYFVRRRIGLGDQSPRQKIR